MNTEELLIDIDRKVTRVETMLLGNGGKGVLPRLDDLEGKPRKQMAIYVGQITVAVGLVMISNVIGHVAGWW